MMVSPFSLDDNGSPPKSGGNPFRPMFIATLAIFSVLLFSPFVLAATTEIEMPSSILIKNKEIVLKDLKNPLRADAGNLKKLVREGGEIYFKNCYLCHGDLLDGSGVFGDRFFPKPANFKSPQSILSRPESYAYWRVMKGGRGLPDKHNPWDSAMPAWEDTLSEEQTWKVILFIYETARETPPPAPDEKPSLERGRDIYLEKCAFCHGETGNGDGPAANFSSPRPRKLNKTQYKIRTTHFGKIPSDQDIFYIISKGMPGTTMPSWNHLPESDRWSLVLFLKSLSNKFEKFYAKGETLETVVAGDPPPATPESLIEGKTLFTQSCSGCHGLEGRSDGESTTRVVNIASDALWPRNLTKPWLFRRGSSLKDIFVTIRTGLTGTAMPRFAENALKDQQVWSLAHYVKSLAISENRPEIKPIQAKRISGEIPLDPDAPAWKTASPHFFPLAGQIIQSKKSYYPTVDAVTVKALHNGDELALHLSWDDPTFDPKLKKLTKVEESPPPPLPSDMPQETSPTPSEDKSDDDEVELLPDAIAIQFPVDPGAPKPYFLNGDAERPVNLWKWNSRPMEALESNARGMDKVLAQSKESQNLTAKAVYRYGSYHLVVKRKMTTTDKQIDIHFKPGQHAPIAFNIWDGSAKETDSQKAISSWFEMILEP